MNSVWITRRNFVAGVSVTSLIATAGCSDEQSPDGESSQTPESGEARFETNITIIDDSVVRGEPLNISYTIQNSGEVSGEEQIRIRIGEQVIEESVIELGNGEEHTQQITEEINTDADKIELQISSESDQTTKSTTVLDPADLQFGVTDMPNVVQSNQPFTIRLEASNHGDIATSTAITGSVADQSDRWEFTLPGNTQKGYEFSFNGVSDPGLYIVQFNEEGSELMATNEIEVGEVNFETEIEHDEAMLVGEDQSVTVTVENVGTISGSSEIQFQFHTVEDSQTVSLEPDQSTEFTFDFTVPDDPGEYNLRVANEEVLSNEVSIIQPDDIFELTDIVEGGWSCFSVAAFEDLESVDWEFEVTNSGGVEIGADTVTVEIVAFDGAERTVARFDSRGPTPSPGSSSLFRTNKDDLEEESCDYVQKIVDRTNEDGGGFRIDGARW